MIGDPSLQAASERHRIVSQADASREPRRNIERKNKDRALGLCPDTTESSGECLPSEEADPLILRSFLGKEKAFFESGKTGRKSAGNTYSSKQIPNARYCGTTT